MDKVAKEANSKQKEIGETMKKFQLHSAMGYLAASLCWCSLVLSDIPYPSHASHFYKPFFGFSITKYLKAGKCHNFKPGQLKLFLNILVTLESAPTLQDWCYWNLTTEDTERREVKERRSASVCLDLRDEDIPTSDFWSSCFPIP